MAAAYNKYGIANYSADHRVVFDGEDTYVKVWQPAGGDHGISSRLSRSTFAHSLKSFPRQAPSIAQREAIITSSGGSFRDVSASEVDSITTRLNKRASSCRTRRHGEPVQPVKSNYTPRHPSGRVSQERVDAITARLYSRYSETGDRDVRYQEKSTTPRSARSNIQRSKPKSAAHTRRRYYSGSDQDSDKSQNNRQSQYKYKQADTDSQTSTDISRKSSLAGRKDSTTSSNRLLSQNKCEPDSRPESAMSERSTTSTVKSGSYPRSRSSSASSEAHTPRSRKHSSSGGISEDTIQSSSKQTNRSVSPPQSQGSPGSKYGHKSRKSRSSRSPSAHRRHPSYDDSSSDEENLEPVKRYKRKKEKEKSENLLEDSERNEVKNYSDNNQHGEEKNNNNEEIKSSRASSLTSVKGGHQSSRSNTQRKSSVNSSIGVQNKITGRPDSSRSTKSQNSDINNSKRGMSRQNSAKSERSDIMNGRRDSRRLSSSKQSVSNPKRTPSGVSVSTSRISSARSDMLNGNSRRSSVASNVSVNYRTFSKASSSPSHHRKSNDVQNGNVSSRKNSTVNLSKENVKRSNSQTSLHSHNSSKMANLQAKEARAGLLKVLLDEDKKKNGGSMSSLKTDDQSETEGR